MRANMDVMDQLGGAAALDDDKNAELALRTLAGLNQRTGRVMDEIGKHDEAERYFKKMDELADRLAARNPKAIEPKKVKAASLNTLGDFYLLSKGDVRGSLRFHEQALEYRRQWAALEPRNDEAKRGVANTLGAVARDWLTLGDPVKAREIYREEISIRDQFTHDFGSQLEVRRERTGLLEKIGDLCVALGDVEEAPRAWRSR